MPKIVSFPDVPGKEFEVGDDFTPEDIDEIYDEVRPSTGVFRKAIGDTAVALSKGVVALPQSLAGLVDIAGGLTGAGSFTEFIKPVVDFETTQTELGKLYSPDAKRAQRRVDQAKGVYDTLTTVLKNPSIIQQQIGESLPSMLGGAAAAKKLIGAGVGRATAAGIGEGTITAGQQATDIAQATPGKELSRGQAGAALVSGVFTGALGGFGSKMAGKLGVADIDTLTNPTTSEAVKRGIIARVIGGVITEGALEELPQSLQEQIAKNLATNKPWNEGLEKAGVIGGIVGGIMGGGMGVVSGGRGTPTEPAPSADIPVTPTETAPVVDYDQASADDIQSEIEQKLGSDVQLYDEGRPIDQSGSLPPEPAVVPPQAEIVPPEPNLLPLTTQVLKETEAVLPVPITQDDTVRAIIEDSGIEIEGVAPETLSPESESALKGFAPQNVQPEVTAEPREEVTTKPRAQMSPKEVLDSATAEQDPMSVLRQHYEDIRKSVKEGNPINIVAADKYEPDVPGLKNLAEWLRSHGWVKHADNWIIKGGKEWNEAIKKFPIPKIKAPEVTAEQGKSKVGVQGGVPYYQKLGAQDAKDPSRKRMRSVPQNFKLAYLNGWYAAKKDKTAAPIRADVTDDTAIDRAISALESKIKAPGDTTQAVIIPGFDPATARAVYNTALRVAIGVLKSTRNLQRAIRDAIAHIKSTRPLTADQEDALRRALESGVAYEKGIITRGAMHLVRGSSLPVAMVQARRQNFDFQKFMEATLRLKTEDTKAAIASEFKTKADQDAARDRLSEYLNGMVPVSAIGGPEVQRQSTGLRKAIDDLSAMAVTKGMVTGDMANTWLGNMGQWLKRTYLAFDPTSDWNYATLKRRKDKGDRDVTKIWNDTVAFLKAENPKWNNARIEAEMRSLINRVTVEEILGISKPPPGQGQRFSVEISSLFRRKEIPPEIRAWMGEIKDPYAKVLQSGKWLAQFITRNLAQREVARIGLETGVLSEKKTGLYTEQLFPPEPKFVPDIDPATGAIKTDPSGQPIGKWVTQVDRRHEPLSGYWTTPEFAAALSEFDQRMNNSSALMDFGSLVGKGILTGTAYQKGALVGWNPASYGVNTIGALVMRAATGRVNPLKLRRALNAVAYGERPIDAASTNKSLQARADYLMATKAGVLGKGILLGDIDANLFREREGGAGKRAIASIKGILNDPKSKGKWIQLKRAIDDLWRIPGDYGIKFMDDVFRSTAFFDELQLATEAMPSATKEEQVRWAADRASNIYQNYDRLPKVLKDASRFGFLNTFVSFKAEMFRNAYWIARYAKEGLQSGNPALVRDGALKLAGLSIMSVLPFALSGLSKAKNDVDDDEDKAMKRWIVPPWDRSEELVYIKASGGKYTYVPMGYLLPTFEYSRPVTTVLNAAKDPNPDEATMKALSGWASDYLGPGAFLGPLYEAGANVRLGSDRKVTLKRGLEGAQERAGHAAESFVPRGIRMLEEAYKAYNKIPGDFGREYSFNEIAAKLGGLRERTVDVHKSAKYVIRGLGNRWREASQVESGAKSKFGKGTEKHKAAIAYETQEKAKIKSLYNLAKSDLQKLGVSKNELIDLESDERIPMDLR